MEIEPIKCEHITREPNIDERRYAGNNMIYEVRIDFHFWNGTKWIQFGIKKTEVLTKQMIGIIDNYSIRMEKDCWNWLSDALKKGEITHDDEGHETTSKILAIAKYPTFFTEESE